MDRFWDRLARFINRHCAKLSVLSVLFFVIGSYYSFLLFSNLRTDLEELLPTTARSVLDLDEVTKRLETIDSISIIVRSSKPKNAKLLVEEIVKRLAKAPRESIARVEYKIDKEIAFFNERKPLFIDLEDLVRIRNYIRDRIQYEKEIRNPLNIFRSSNIPEPKLDFEALLQKYKSRSSRFDRFPSGHYATSDGTTRVVNVYLPGKSSGISAALALKTLIDKSIAEARSETKLKDVDIYFAGNIQNLIEEHHALIEDLGLSTVIVILLVTLAMWIYYRSALYTTLLVASLFVGTVVTFGISFFTVGYLNANSAFLGSIVIGNGINFGIILLARYLEERRGGRTHENALALSMGGTFTGTATAALAAGAAYGSLMLTSFRGFSQFGVIGLTGMLLCWLSAFSVLPAFISLSHRLLPRYSQVRTRGVGKFPNLLANFVKARPGLIWAASILVTLAALAASFRISDDIIETDLTQMRSAKSFESGSAYYSKYLDLVFGRDLAPVVILTKNQEFAEEIAQKLRDKMKKEGHSSGIDSVQGIWDFVPKQQNEKLSVIAEIRNLLPPRLLSRMEKKDQDLVKELTGDPSLKSFSLEEVPDLIKTNFRERDGTVGSMVLVNRPLTKDKDHVRKFIQFVNDLRSTADSVHPGSPVAGQLPITADMFESILKDGPKATLFALLSVTFIVIALFRSLSNIFLTLFALGLGVIWMCGALIWADVKINFLNFIAFPITFGIGVDYGVNIFQRYRDQIDKDILEVIRTTGSAVCLASLTTIIGYGSLLIASNRAFVSFGTVAVLGEVTCLVAAILCLPAFLIFQQSRANKRAKRGPEF